LCRLCCHDLTIGRRARHHKPFLRNRIPLQ
jgi:hypothetical protein